MALITFMSDFGTVDHYVATVKAAILSSETSQVIVDITHDIRVFDIAHAAYVLKHSYREFPKKTVHLVAVDTVRTKSKLIAIRLEDHYFVGFDCGLFSLISDQKPSQIVTLPEESSTFPAKDVLALAAARLAKGASLSSLGTPLENMQELYDRQLKVTKREIVGNVVAVDYYGNLITNIARAAFEKIIEINGGDGVRYAVKFGREVFDRFHTYFSDVESGDCYLLFNSSGFLQIGINKGNAAELLGMSVDAPVIIEFSN